MTPEEKQQYTHEVVLALSGKEPADTWLSNADITTIGDWIRQDIPLRVVLQAIEQVKVRRNFDNVKNPILYLRPAVEEEWNRVRRARA